MQTTPLFPLPEGLEMVAISETSEELFVHVISHRATSPCPQCSIPSSAIHSSYSRHPRDLPCVGRPIRLLFSVRKFFCRNPDCPRKVFTERLSDFIEASSRLTKRLRTSVQDIGFATCGLGGERLSNKLGMPMCDATILWSLFLAPIPDVGQIPVVGVDDWSWRRGKRFGSILVNLETHKIVDLLAGPGGSERARVVGGTPGSGCGQSRSWRLLYRWCHPRCAPGDPGRGQVAHHV